MNRDTINREKRHILYGTVKRLLKRHSTYTSIHIFQSIIPIIVVLEY